MLQNPKSRFLDRLNKRMTECFVCSNANTKGGVYFSDTFKNLDCIFIAQNPGKSWYNKTVDPGAIVPFGLNESNSYNRFFTALSLKFYEIFHRPLNFYVTNVVKCSTIDNTVTDENIEKCPKRFLNIELSILENFSPTVKTVALGKAAWAVYGLNCFCLPHPGWMNRQPKEVLEEGVRNLMEFYRIKI